MTNPNEPAFLKSSKQVTEPSQMAPQGQVTYEVPCYGLTKREYFAAMALQGMMSLNPPDMFQWADPKDGTVGDWVAINCVQVADALIKELSK